MVVAPLGHPGGAEVPATHVGGDGQPLRPPGEGAVDGGDVGLVLALRIPAERGDVRPLPGVVEVREAGVVELQVAAAEDGEPAHLLRVGGGEIRPELVELRVHGGVDRRPAAAVVDHARRGDGELRRRRPHGVAEEGEVVPEDRPLERDRPVDTDRGRRELQAPGLVDELHAQRGVVDPGHPAERVDEVHVPGRAPELAVGGAAQAGVLLHPHRVADGRILDATQRGGIDATRGAVRPRGEHLRWPEQAADVVGPERWRVAAGHHPSLAW